MKKPKFKIGNEVIGPAYHLKNMMPGIESDNERVLYGAIKSALYIYETWCYRIDDTSFFLVEHNMSTHGEKHHNSN